MMVSEIERIKKKTVQDEVLILVLVDDGLGVLWRRRKGFDPPKS